MRFLIGLLGVVALTACAHAPSAHARFSFIAVVVADVDVSAAWYAQTFGLRDANRVTGDTYDVRILASEELMVELIELSPLPPETPEDARGIFKAGFEIADWDERVAAWRAAGVRFHNDRILFDETLQLHYLIIEDPDGNLIQVFARPSD